MGSSLGEGTLGSINLWWSNITKSNGLKQETFIHSSEGHKSEIKLLIQEHSLSSFRKKILVSLTSDHFSCDFLLSVSSRMDMTIAILYWIRASMIIYLPNLLRSGLFSSPIGGMEYVYRDYGESKSLRDFPKVPLSPILCRRWNAGKLWDSGYIAPSIWPMGVFILQRYNILCVIHEVDGILQSYSCR